MKQTLTLFVALTTLALSANAQTLKWSYKLEDSTPTEFRNSTIREEDFHARSDTAGNLAVMFNYYTPGTFDIEGYGVLWVSRSGKLIGRVAIPAAEGFIDDTLGNPIVRVSAKYLLIKQSHPSNSTCYVRRFSLKGKEIVWNGLTIATPASGGDDIWLEDGDFRKAAIYDPNGFFVFSRNGESLAEIRYYTAK